MCLEPSNLCMEFDDYAQLQMGMKLWHIPGNDMQYWALAGGSGEKADHTIKNVRLLAEIERREADERRTIMQLESQPEETLTNEQQIFLRL